MPRPLAHNRRSFRPVLEALEDRSVPAVSLVATGNVPADHGGGPFTPADINDKGQLIGGHFLYSGGSLTHYDLEPHSFFTYQFVALNDAGAAVGTYTGATTLGIRYTSQTSVALSPSYGAGVGQGLYYGSCDVIDINDAGDALGTSQGYNIDSKTAQEIGPYHQFATVWKAGTQQATFLPVPEPSTGKAINNAGQVVGNDPKGAFVLTGGTLVQLPPLAGTTGTSATDISNDGAVIGHSGGQGVIWQIDTKTHKYKATALDLDPLRINASHVVLGTLNGSPAVWPGHGKSIPLSNLIPASLGWQVGTAVGINDSNQIAGMGTHNGMQTGYILSGLQFPDIKLDDATTTDLAHFKSIDVKYTISDATAPLKFKFAAYLSADEKLDKDGPGADEKLDGTLTVTQGNGTHNGHLKLDGDTEITSARRFLIVLADSDDQIKETDEDNNARFVIPLFPASGSAKKGGFRPSDGRFVSGLSEAAAVKAVSARISRGTADFKALTALDNVWAGVNGTFKDEEPAPYKGDDHLGSKSLLGPLRELVKLIKAARDDERIDLPAPVITEAFDEQGEHSSTSAHYEGRAIDLRASGDLAQRLTGLLLLAGFGWVQNEANHAHGSVAGPHASATLLTLRQALDFGRTTNLIGQSRYKLLLSDLTAATSLAAHKTLTVSQRKKIRATLDDFIKNTKSGLLGGSVRQPTKAASPNLTQNTDIGALLIFNATVVEKQF